jgi:tetratricopeptide (TPR) repeat protein/tRNA A-37 threonylcarbamoyl transferase component Bud32
MPEDSNGQSDREEKLNAILRAYLEAVDEGKPPDHQEWLRQHADFSAELEEFLADYEHVERAVEPLRPAAAPVVPVSPNGAAPGDPTATAVDWPAGLSVGATVRYFGDYELLEEIARGGMGVVFKARQISLNRIVAVKMVLAGILATKADHDRFHSEAQAAALLDHPNIVPVYEVGEYEGQHYFSMGYVDGQSLGARLAEGPLPPKEAAELVATVAEAVQYAHQQGVIHRDIKPSNIVIDCQGRPRVTDFGLAKRVDSGSDLTATGQVLGTPSYMPPEQAAGQINAVGPAADVYALGALLFASLTARPPFQAATPFETLQQVIDQEPVAVRQLNAAVPRDLETIVLKCLEKAVPRRYASAQALADDLRRYLGGRPILARPVGRWERAWRWCRRNRLVAALSAAAILLLVSVAVVASIGYVTSTRALRRADTEKRTEQAVRDFLQHKLLGQADTEVQANLLLEAGESTTEVSPNPTVRELLDRAARELAPDRIEASFPKQPLVQAELLVTVGKTYSGIGAYGPAEALLARAVELRQRDLGAEHPDTLSAQRDLADTYQSAWKLPEAIELYSKVRGVQEKAANIDDPEALSTLQGLAGAYFAAGRLSEAIELYERVRDARIKLLGAEHRDTLATLNNLASIYMEAGKMPQAVELSERVHAAALRSFSAEHPYTLTALLNLGTVYLRDGRREKAVTLLEQLRDTSLRKLGPENPFTLRTISALGYAYVQSAKLKPEYLPCAFELLVQTREAQARTLGANYPDTLVTVEHLAMANVAAGKPAAAIELFQQVYDAKAKKLGPDHPLTLVSAFSLARACQILGNLPRAMELLKQVRDAQEKALGADHPYVLTTLEEIGIVQHMSGKPVEAIATLEKVRAARVKLFSDEHPFTLATTEELAAAYYDARNLSSAIKLYEQVREVRVRKFGADHYSTISTMCSLARCYQADGRLSQALPLFEQAAAGVEKLNYFHPNAPAIVASAIAAYETAGQFDKAEPLRRKTLAIVKRVVGPQSPAYANELSLLGLNLVHQKKFSDSDPVLRECLQLREKLLPQKKAAPWQIANVKSMLGEALLRQGKTAEAGPFLVAGYDGLKQDEKAIPDVARAARMSEAIQRLIDLARATNKPDDEKKWRAELAKYALQKPAAPPK